MNEWEVCVVVEPHITGNRYIYRIAIVYKWQAVMLGKLRKTENWNCIFVEAD